MEEIMYGSEQFKKKNGYSKKKRLSPEERKEKTAQRQAKLFDRLNKMSSNNINCNEKSLNNANSIETVSDSKPSIKDLQSLVNNIQNR